MRKLLLTVAVTSLLMSPAIGQNLEQGIQYYNYERYQSAESELNSLTASNAQANYYYGLAQIGLEDYTGAATTFNKDASDFYNMAGMARVMFMNHKVSQGEKLLDDVVSKAKKKDWERYQVAADAITYTDGGDINKAIEWYTKAIGINSKNAMLYIGRGDAYLKLETGGGQAMTDYESAIQIGTHNSLAYSRVGYLWYVAHTYNSALDAYNKAKDADPSNPLPYRDLANAYQRSGNYENALENDELYLQHSDNSINDQIEYANILFLAKKYDKAQEKMEQLIKNGNERPYMYRIIGYTSYEDSNYVKALDNMNSFFQKERDTTKYIMDDYMYYGKINAALATQDSSKRVAYAQKAESAFAKAISMDTAVDKSDEYRMVAENYKDNKVYDKAGEWYGKIIKDNPNAPALDYFWWGYWSFFGQKYTIAEEAFTAMKEKYPTEGSAYFWLARTAAAQDSKAQTGAAVEPYETWLNFEAEGYEKKDKDEMQAYQYLAYYYYNKDDGANSTKWAKKILELEPDNEFGNQIVDYFKAAKTGKK